MSATLEECPACGEPAGPDDAFCESCGAALGGDTPDGSDVSASKTTVSLPTLEFPVGDCRRCGGVVGDDGWCTTCGVRRLANEDHDEIDLGRAAGVSDRGLRHRRNDDAMAVATGDGWTIAVVCDGVSTSANADEASKAAATAMLEALTASVPGAAAPPADGGPDPLDEALIDGVASARAAVAAVQATEGSQTVDPSTTLVAAVVGPGRIVVANVGDSRAYWLSPGGDAQLTVDDSLAEEAIAAGIDASDAYRAPEAHMITRWLGADADGGPPTITCRPLDGPGTLVVCSDGLWNYAPGVDDLVAAVAQGGPTPLDLARHLTRFALDAGGHDNVTVVVIPTGPDGAADGAEQEA